VTNSHSLILFVFVLTFPCMSCIIFPHCLSSVVTVQITAITLKLALYWLYNGVCVLSVSTD
jgi:hypothetical protein